MKRAVNAFDRWLARSPVSDVDVAIYRILYAGFLLLNPRRAEFALDLPAMAWDPPWGPMRIFASPPPEAFVSAIAAVVAIALGFLLFGWFTRTSSIVVGLGQVLLYGISYSYGKIDHTILIALAPLLLAWSGWGRRLSMDALRKRLPSTFDWPHRLLAIAIGLAFITAALPKIRGGWLDPDTQATRGHFLAQWLGGSNDGFSQLLKAADWPVAWEAADLFTIALELGLILTVLNWKAFRIGLALAALFHFGIMLTLGITFYANVVAYGAFVSWTVVLGRPEPFEIPAGLRRWVERGWPIVIAALLFAAGSWLFGTLAPGALARVMNRTLVTAAAAGGVAYLLSFAVDLVASLRRRRDTLR